MNGNVKQNMSTLYHLLSDILSMLYIHHSQGNIQILNTWCLLEDDLGQVRDVLIPRYTSDIENNMCKLFNNILNYLVYYIFIRYYLRICIL